MTRYFDEQHEGAGYEETHSEGETVTGGGILDEDFATSGVTGAPADWDAQCLRALSDDGGGVYVGHDFSSSRTLVYFRAEIIVKTFPNISSNFSNRELITISNDASTIVFQFTMQRRDSLSPNGFNWNFRINQAGAGLVSQADSTNDIALDTRYRLECKFDAPNNVWAWRKDGAAVKDGTLTSTHPTELQNNFRYGWPSSSPTPDAEIFIDNVAFDDADWVGAEPTFISYPYPRYGLTGGMQPMQGGV